MSPIPKPDRGPSPEDYGSALDLPTVANLLAQIQGMKLITRFVLRGQRQSMVDLEKEVRKLASIVDTFYALLGPRNWVFHDELNVPLAERLVTLPARRFRKDPSTTIACGPSPTTERPAAATAVAWTSFPRR